MSSNLQSRPTTSPSAFKLGVVVLSGLTFALFQILASASPASAQGLTNQCGSGGAASSGEFCQANIQYLSNGLAYWGLIICVIGVFVSATLWALGSKGQNPGQELTGKRGFIVCFAGAFAIGAAIPVINFMSDQARTVAPPAATTGGGNAGERSPNPFDNNGGPTAGRGGAGQSQDSQSGTAQTPAPNNFGPGSGIGSSAEVGRL